MRVFVIGAGEVGTAVVDALHDEQELVVIDLDPLRLRALSFRYDVVGVEGSGASRRTLREAGICNGDLLIACTSRDEVNIVASMLAKKLAPEPDDHRAGDERRVPGGLAGARARRRLHGLVRARGRPRDHTDHRRARGTPDRRLRRRARRWSSSTSSRPGKGRARPRRRRNPLRDAEIPPDPKVAAIIRGERATVPRGDEAIAPGDRVVVIGSPDAARAWSRLLGAGRGAVDDVVVYGAGQTGVAVAAALLEQHVGVRLVEPDADRARVVAETLHGARVFHATGLDPEFLERERIGRAQAAVFTMHEDARNLYAATLAKTVGVGSPSRSCTSRPPTASSMRPASTWS